MYSKFVTPPLSSSVSNSLGKQTYELLTGKVLFNLKTEEESSAEEMVHLAQMTQIAGETFKKDAKKLLKKSTVRERYFDDKGIRSPQLQCWSCRDYPDLGDLRQAMEKGVNNSMEDALKEVLDPDRVDHTMKFIRSCLRLDPQLRPSAVELAISDWLSNALIAGDYRPPKDRFGTEVGSRVSLEKLME
jgi:serine/threonine protein kinase